MRRKRFPLSTQSSQDPETSFDGSIHAMEQMGNWVRFADRKATILIAGLGIIITMLMTYVENVASVMYERSFQSAVVSALAIGTIGAFLWTLFWLVRAIGPQTKTEYVHPNRFAWPSLQKVNLETLTEHTKETTISEDAWLQVLDLSVVAGRKFNACGKAVNGFVLMSILGLTCIAVSAVISI